MRRRSTTYRVTWDIDIDAESALDAARKALEIQRDPESIATIFDVRSPMGSRRQIDLRPRRAGLPRRLAGMIAAAIAE